MNKKIGTNATNAGLSQVSASVEWSGREELSVILQIDSLGTVQSANVRGVGGPKFLKQLVQFRSEINGQKISELKYPEGIDPEHICFREAILKLQQAWTFPYQEEELCHCRAVLTATVDQAICMGAHTTKKVSRVTSASTACGTCRPNVDAIIKFRLGKK